MGSLTCVPTCAANPAVTIVSMPCFKCVVPAA